MKASTQGFLSIAVAWILLVIYSVFLISVAESLIDYFNIVIDDGNTKQIVIFLYGLAVVSFLGGSQIPAVFLKKKSFVVQFSFSATFGLILLLITISSETILKPVNDIVRLFFLDYPIAGIEYLCIPYFFMIFIDLYMSGRLSAFSWKNFSRFLKGAILHPQRTFEEMVHASAKSTLFSLVSVILISGLWIARTLAFSTMDFLPARWRVVSFQIGGSIEPLSKATLITPAVLFLWLVMSFLVSEIGDALGGRGSWHNTASLLGFAFLPSSTVIIVDLLELVLHFRSVIMPEVIFFILGFIIPLVLWPVALVTFAVQTSKNLSLKSSVFTAIAAFLPLYVLLANSLL